MGRKRSRRRLSGAEAVRLASLRDARRRKRSGDVPFGGAAEANRRRMERVERQRDQEEKERLAVAAEVDWHLARIQGNSDVAAPWDAPFVSSLRRHLAADRSDRALAVGLGVALATLTPADGEGALLDRLVAATSPAVVAARRDPVLMSFVRGRLATAYRRKVQARARRAAPVFSDAEVRADLAAEIRRGEQAARARPVDTRY